MPTCAVSRTILSFFPQPDVVPLASCLWSRIMCGSPMACIRKSGWRLGQIAHVAGILGKGSDHEEKCAASCYGLLCLFVRAGGLFTRSVSAICVRTDREGFYIRAYHRPNQPGRTYCR